MLGLRSGGRIIERFIECFAEKRSSWLVSRFSKSPVGSIEENSYWNRNIFISRGRKRWSTRSSLYFFIRFFFSFYFWLWYCHYLNVHRHCNAVYNQNLIDRWMKGCILPFPKKGDLGLAKNYRGMTLTSIAAKIYNALIRNCIEPKIDNILR